MHIWNTDAFTKQENDVAAFSKQLDFNFFLKKKKGSKLFSRHEMIFFPRTVFPINSTDL